MIEEGSAFRKLLSEQFYRFCIMICNRTCYRWGGVVNLFIHVTVIVEIDQSLLPADWLIAVTWYQQIYDPSPLIAYPIASCNLCPPHHKGCLPEISKHFS